MPGFPIDPTPINHGQLPGLAHAVRPPIDPLPYLTLTPSQLPIRTLILQEVIRNRFLRRHTSRILRRGLKNAIPASRPIAIPLFTQHRT